MQIPEQFVKFVKLSKTLNELESVTKRLISFQKYYFSENSVKLLCRNSSEMS